MPTPTALESRWSGIKSCLRITLNTLDILAENVQSSFLKPIALTTRSVVTAAETMKDAKSECFDLLEEINALLNAVITLHVESPTGTDLPPNILSHLGGLVQTVNKIYSFVEAHQESSRIKRFLRQTETNGLLKSCREGVQQASQNFKMIYESSVRVELDAMQELARNRQREVLALIEDQSGSDTTSIDGHSIFSSAYNSSNSLRMLPSRPNIFHGRESEQKDIIHLFAEGTPRIAILGAGGIGKTSLAREILHHPQILDRFKERAFFVPCDAASSVEELITTIASHLGLQPSRSLRKQLLRRLSEGPPSLLVLDNLETVWEPTTLRPQVEELLSILTEIAHLALMITMRGAERPAGVRWTRPFLVPLKPLPDAAARQTFIDIADDGHEEEELAQVLRLTDNVPLAVTLMAHLVDSEGCSAVLSNWERERTSLVSDGRNKRSNLDMSISLSLSSPRVTPQAMQLLMLLSILPDGLSDAELLQSNLQIFNPLACKAALLRTSLAYTTDQQRVKSLVPIREYMQQHHPPATNLVQPLSDYYQQLAHLCDRQWGFVGNVDVAARVHLNYANIQSILLRHLQEGAFERAGVIDFILCLNTFSRRNNREISPLVARIPELLSSPMDARLNVSYITEVLLDLRLPLPDSCVIDAVLASIHMVDDINVRCKLYKALSWRYNGSDDLTAAKNMCLAGLALLQTNEDPVAESRFLDDLASIKRRTGDFAGGHADSKRAVSLARVSGNFYWQASTLMGEIKCTNELGEYAVSLALCQQAANLLALSGALGSKTHCFVLSTQANVHMLKSEYTQAREIYTEIIRSSEQDPYAYAMTLTHLAEIDILLGASKLDIEPQIDAAYTIYCNIQVGLERLICDLLRADLSIRDGDHSKEIPEYNEILIKHSEGDVDLGSYCLERLNLLHRHTPSNWPHVWLAHSLKFKRARETHQALQFLGYSFRDQGDVRTATSLLTTALDGFTRMDIHRSRAECMAELGDLSREKQDVVQARQLWTTAIVLFERSSLDKQARDLEERLARLEQPERVPLSSA